MTRVSYNRLHRPKNSSNWYFRAKVPAELRELYGKREEKKSLDTSDKREAAELAVPYSWAFDSKIKALRERLNIQSDDRKSLSQCDQRDINQMVVRWFQEKMDKLGVDGMSGSLSREEALHELRIDEDELIANDESIKSSLNNNAVHIAADNNLRLEERFKSGELKRKVRQPFRLPNEDLSSPQYERLTDLLRRGLLELTKQSIAELEGDFSGEVTDKLFKHLIEGERTPTPQPVHSTSGKPSITLEELKDRFFAHKGHDPKNRKNLYCPSSKH